MQGYIDSYDERAAEIEKDFTYDGYQIVRREMFAHLREPAITIRKDSIAFNAACIDGLEDAVYIHVMINEDDKRIVIRKCEENDLESIRWCVAKGDRRKSRNIKGEFSKIIYKLMEWSDGCRYKVLGHKIQHEGVTLYVFELERYEKFKERHKRTAEEKAEREKTMTAEEIAEQDRRERRESMIPFSPADAENTFGLPVDQYSRKIVLGSLNGYEKMDVTAKRGSDKAKKGNEITNSFSEESLSYAARGHDGDAGNVIQTYGAHEPDREADQGITHKATFAGTDEAASLELTGAAAGKGGGDE